MEKNTNIRPADYVRYRIGRFSQAVQVVKENRERLSAFGAEYAAMPYCEKQNILRLLDDMELDPASREELCSEFRAVITILEDHQGLPDWHGRSQLLHDLSLYTDVYRAEICHGHWSSCNGQCDDTYPIRERIGALISELSSDSDLSGLCRLISNLDEQQGTSMMIQAGPDGTNIPNDETVSGSHYGDMERIGSRPACP